MGESAMAVGSAALEFTPDVEALTAPVWEKVRTRVTPIEWRLHAPLIAEINRLKREKSAVILAHNYMTPGLIELRIVPTTRATQPDRHGVPSENE
jgi:quinolinate synthase